jgi:hypothetical protein
VKFFFTVERGTARSHPHIRHYPTGNPNDPFISLDKCVRIYLSLLLGTVIVGPLCEADDSFKAHLNGEN